MKILVSTKKKQMQRKNDFCFVPEGEIVILPFFECGNGGVDDDCGCRRCLNGIKSLTGTTTFEVADIGICKIEFVKLYKKAMIKAGFGKAFKRKDNELKIELENQLFDNVAKLTKLAENYPVGTVLERRELIWKRT